MPTPAELYELYLLNNPDGERLIEVVTISHSAMTQTYHITPTPEAVSVTFEDSTVLRSRAALSKSDTVKAM